MLPGGLKIQRSIFKWEAHGEDNQISDIQIIRTIQINRCWMDSLRCLYPSSQTNRYYPISWFNPSPGITTFGSPVPSSINSSHPDVQHDDPIRSQVIWLIYENHLERWLIKFLQSAKCWPLVVKETIPGIIYWYLFLTVSFRQGTQVILSIMMTCI